MYQLCKNICIMFVSQRWKYHMIWEDYFESHLLLQIQLGGRNTAVNMFNFVASIVPADDLQRYLQT